MGPGDEAFRSAHMDLETALIALPWIRGASNNVLGNCHGSPAMDKLDCILVVGLPADLEPGGESLKEWGHGNNPSVKCFSDKVWKKVTGYVIAGRAGVLSLA